MEKEEVTIGSPVTAGGVTLLPISQIRLSHVCGQGWVSFYGTKQPTAILAISASGMTAFRITGEEVPLDQLIEEVPQIRHVVETTNPRF